MGSISSLLQCALSPVFEASNGDSAERLRVTVLPGFSFLAMFIALRLRGTLTWGWPAHAECLLIETLKDEGGNCFVRFWQLRDSHECKPGWHTNGGPVSLGALLQAMPLLEYEA